MPSRSTAHASRSTGGAPAPQSRQPAAQARCRGDDVHRRPRDVVHQGEPRRGDHAHAARRRRDEGAPDRRSALAGSQGGNPRARAGARRGQEGKVSRAMSEDNKDVGMSATLVLPDETLVLPGAAGTDATLLAKGTEPARPGAPAGGRRSSRRRALRNPRGARARRARPRGARATRSSGARSRSRNSASATPASRAGSCARR